MKQKQPRNRGLKAFNDYFADYYQDRWPSLLAALQDKPSACALSNPFADLSDEERYDLHETVTVRCKTPWQSLNGLKSHYALDRASLLAADILPLDGAKRVLDMCAAPGGKALALIFRGEKDAKFVLNERSAQRRSRLKKVIDEYLPSEAKQKIVITGHDATKWGLHEKAAYDAVLLDAPCSSERHLLDQPTLLKEWSPRRTMSLAIQQFAMLAAAGDAVKPGGHILYATCSISASENDDVISKLLNRRDQFEIIKLKFDLGEPTSHGWIFLPDVCRMGPLFVSLIRRYR